MTDPCVSPATLIAEGLRQGCIEWRNSNATLVGLEWRNSNATLVGLEWRNSNATLVGLEWRNSNATLVGLEWRSSSATRDSVRAIIGLAFFIFHRGPLETSGSSGFLTTSWTNIWALCFTTETYAKTHADSTLRFSNTPSVHVFLLCF